jgi:hypothetical protein
MHMLSHLALRLSSAQLVAVVATFNALSLISAAVTIALTLAGAR